MLIDSQRTVGSRVLITRTFENVGDVLPMHSHPVGHEHMTVVRSGSFHVSGPGWERTLGPGDMIVFEADKPHEIRALTAGAKLTNIPF